ncbi:hypothetical protein D3C75_682360 [compost metagenome]
MIHVFHHGGQGYFIAELDGLVLVHADYPYLLAVLHTVLGFVEYAGAGSAGSMEDDVHAVIIHGGGSSLAQVGLVEGAGVVDGYLGIGVGGGYACLEACLEALDHDDVHAADKTNLVGFGHQAGHNADQVGAFLLGEGNGLHVGSFHNLINNSQLCIGVGGRHLLHGVADNEADAPGQVIVILDEGVQVRLEFSVVLGLQIFYFSTGIGLQLLQSFPSGLVKGFVVYATHVGNHAYLKACCFGGCRACCCRSGGCCSRRRRSRSLCVVFLFAAAGKSRHKHQGCRR